MLLSVVIPALNEERHLGQLLSDIQRQSLRPEEVIVVDAGSTDATVRIAEQSQTVVLYGKPPVAHGRNLGGYGATGELIFFLDADTRLPELRRDLGDEAGRAPDGLGTRPVIRSS